MFSPETNYWVCQEQHKDRLRKLARQQALQGIKEQNVVTFKLHQRAIGWLGTQMVVWGSKLQVYSASSLPKKIAHEIQ